MRVLPWLAAVLAALAAAPGVAHADPISAWIVTSLTSAAFAATTAGTVLIAATTFALTTAGSWVLSKLVGPKQPSAPERQASVITMSLGEQPREYLFGQPATAGQLVDAYNSGGMYGTEWETLVIAVADHQVEALVGYYVGEVYYPYVAAGVQPGFSGSLSISFQAGTIDQTTTDDRVVSGGWAATDRLAGVAHVIVAYRADAPDADAPVWTGRPQFLWVVKGARLYDPRKDSTVPGGSGLHRWEDPGSWEWSDNAYLARYNYARGIYAGGQVTDSKMLLIGRGLSADEAPPERAIARANICDELVTLKAGGTQKRYTANGVVRSTESFIAVEEMFARTMAGVIVQPDGGVDIDPGVSKAAVLSFTDADLPVGLPVRVEHFLSDGDRVNVVAPRYIEPEQLWRETAAPVRRSTSDILADGGPKAHAGLSLPFVTNHQQAQRIGEIERRQGRREIRAALTLGPTFSRLEEGDWIQWVSERHFFGEPVTFRVEAQDVDEAYRTQLLLRQVHADDYAWVAATDEGTPGQAPVDEPGSLEPVELSGVLIESFEYVAAGQRVPAVIAVWDTPVDVGVLGVRLEIRVAGEAEVSATMAARANDGQMTTTNGVAPGMNLDGRLVPLGGEGRRRTPSPWIPIVAGDLAVRYILGPNGELNTIEDIQNFLGSIPSKNLWRKSWWVPTNGAAFAEPLDFGDSIWGISFPGDSSAVATVDYPNASAEVGAGYSFQLKARTSGGTANLYGRWVQQDGLPLSDGAEYVFAVTATPTRFVWPDFKSLDPDFASGKFILYRKPDGNGATIIAGDLQCEFGSVATTGWRPNPQDPELLRYAGYLGALNASRNVIYQQATAPAGPDLATGDIWVDTSNALLRTAHFWTGNNWVPYSNLSGAFGNNLYRSTSGTLATLNEFLTSQGVASSVVGQSSWATSSLLDPANVFGRITYLQSDGRVRDYRGLLFGYSIDGTAAKNAQPLSAGTNFVSVAAHSITFPAGSGITTVNIPSFSVSGAASDAYYSVFYRPSNGQWAVDGPTVAWQYFSSPLDWLYVGSIRTQVSAGVWQEPTYIGVPDYCVDVRAVLALGGPAGEAAAGAPLLQMTPDGEGLFVGKIEQNRLGRSDCLTFRTRRGAALTLSVSTPIMTRDGPGYMPRPIRADACAPGLPVPILVGGELVWDEIASIAPAGERQVAKISARDGIFAAGDSPAGPFLFSHNGYAKY